MPKHGIPHLLAALFVAALAACTPPPATTGGAAAEPRPQAEGPLASSLQVETFPDSVRFSLQVTNGSTAAVPITFSSGQSFDFVVERDGREVWRWAADKGFTQAIREERFAPGETRTFSAAWAPPRGTTGSFTARGVLTSVDRRLERVSRFTLP